MRHEGVRFDTTMENQEKTDTNVVEQDVFDQAINWRSTFPATSPCWSCVLSFQFMQNSEIKEQCEQILKSGPFETTGRRDGR